MQMEAQNLHQPMPKEREFSLAPNEDQQLSLVPTIAERGVDLEYTGVIRIGGAHANL